MINECKHSFFSSSLSLNSGDIIFSNFSLEWFKNPLSCQTELTIATKFYDYLGQKHYKKAKIVLMNL